MGLFLNKAEHPNVFRNKQTIEEPNQSYFKLDYFAELVKEQKQVNSKLFNSFRSLESMYEQQKNSQAAQWKEINSQLQSLVEKSFQHEKFESQAMEWLTVLDRNNAEIQRLMEDENMFKQEIADRIESLRQSNQEIVNKLNHYGSSNQKLAEEMGELAGLHKQMTETFAKQDDHQSQVMDRLENQEALMEKTLRQVSNFRSILFERTNYIAERIEKSYNLTSSYVYKLMTGSEQPLTLYMDERKKAESENKGE
ncbi:hypothetical protein [Virgibacillus siamensis]|uniref:hypothetical protein n=1 Tax=Virgibacillus siamensis TaxID=480071 RepID=UPI000985B2F1|nr:hypothetical protein [Virgibacillus siamensis]